MGLKKFTFFLSGLDINYLNQFLKAIDKYISYLYISYIKQNCDVY